jgi:P-type Mg2+ transporter
MNMNQSNLSNFWSLPSDVILKTLGGNLSNGLNTDEAANRLKTIGLNTLESRKAAGPITIFMNQFKSPIVLILLFATILSAFLQDWTDAVIILAIVMISALLSFFQEYRANSATEKLRSQIKIKTNVLRSGRLISIPSEQVVPGDIVLLSAGTLIPADGIILEHRDLFVNQAVLTGETFPVEKLEGAVAESASLAERTNVLFMGTNVRSGNGKMVVVQTGSRTAFGQIASRLTLRPPETEFERGIRRLGFLLTEIMLVMVIAIFAFNVFLMKNVMDSFLFSIALAVGLTPQLLPAIIEINLSRGAAAMAKGGVIVRRLSSIENFGSMNVLCTDKTGTITQGVVRLDGALDPDGEKSDQVFKDAYLNAHFQTGLVNPLDEAIAAIQAPNIEGNTKIDEIPYDFSRKRLTVVVREQNEVGTQKVTLITKGALDGVLNVCTGVQVKGQTSPLDAQKLAAIHEHYEKWSGEGYRVLGVAEKEVPAQQVYTIGDEKELNFSGFLLFFDPPKEGVQDTIQSLEAMGIQMKIITGDNRLVAEHAVRSIGIEVGGILTGHEINQMSDEALWHVANKTSIFAEVDPSQKEKIILALKKMGNVVGYMGDGVNDAPALHAADVGISVDNAVDVAKDAADFVLMKQDLAVLKEGVVQGRKTFANTLKYIFMATSANFGNMFSVAGLSLLLPFLPMLPKQILLINLLTDFPEMTIASDKVDDIYIQKPHKWDISFIRRFMLIFGPLSSIFDFATFGLLILVLKGSQDLFRTGWFVESILSASLVVFSLRTRMPLLRNRPANPLLIVTLLSGLAAILIPYTPIAPLLQFTPLPPIYLGAIAIVVVLYLACAEIAKRYFYKSYHME